MSNNSTRQHQPLSISFVQYNSNEYRSLEQYIEISNESDYLIDIAGYSILIDGENDFIFSQETLVFSHETLKVTEREILRASRSSNVRHNGLFSIAGGKVFLTNSKGDMVSDFRYGRDAHHAIIISHVMPTDSKYSNESEYIEITNISQSTIDISLWHVLTSPANAKFTFPKNSVVKPNRILRLYTNNIDQDGYSFNSQVSVISQSSGCVELLDYKNNLVSQYDYMA